MNNRTIAPAIAALIALAGCSAPAPIEPPVSADAPTNSQPAEVGTTGQRNALKKAENYLEYGAFSRSGLIKQLEFEKFSTDDATWAVDRAKVDWNEQAAKKASSYLESGAFSHQGLVDQLTFEGFTPEQAEHGAAAAGL